MSAPTDEPQPAVERPWSIRWPLRERKPPPQHEEVLEAVADWMERESAEGKWRASLPARAEPRN